MISLRIARAEDAGDIVAIYSPFVKDTAVSFEYEVPETTAFSEKIGQELQKYPWLVAEKEGRVVGYAYASAHRERAAYQWCAESSIYVSGPYHGKGLAKVLYEALLDILALQNIVNVYAGISQPNEPSTMFHVRMGFTPVGVYKKVGFKNGQWHDVLWLHKAIIKHVGQPEPPIPFANADIQNKTARILEEKSNSLNHPHQ